jgi:hypothetical protein
MRTKTLLIATAAALAVGIISSQAQAVYSQNIVGYVNRVAPQGATPLSTSLDLVDSFGNTNNSATNALQNPYNATIGNGPLDSSELIVYTGTKFKAYLFDANPADAAALGQGYTGVTDQSGNFVPAPNLGNGVGYYLLYSQVSGFPASNTVTQVGSVRGATSTGITNTVVLPSSPFTSFAASGLPLGGGFLTGLQFTNLLSQGVLDSCEIQVPKINANGVAQGYTVYLFDSNPADAAALSQPFTGITDQSGNFVTEPQIPVGGSFVFQNGSGAPINLVQTVPLQ